MLEKVLVFRIPDNVRCDGISFKYYLLHVIVKNLFGIASKISKCVQVTLDQSKDFYLKNELGVSHSGEAQNHCKAIELPDLAVYLDMTAFSPIYLSLGTRLCLIAIYSRNFDLGSHFPEKVLDYSVLACESQIRDLSIDS